MNPFITLTKIRGEGYVNINIHHIVCYERKKYRDSENMYTYILLSGGSGISREVEETPDKIDMMINHVVLSIPFTHKGA